MSSTAAVTPVDEVLPVSRLVPLGLQHVLVMYAGAIAVPLIVGRALKLSPEQVALLISADLFCCGLVTLIQSLGCHALVRHPAAGDDGRDLRLGRPDGGDGQPIRTLGMHRHLRRDHRRRRDFDPDRAVRRPVAAAVSAGGHRHHHRGDRHHADARGDRLGGRRRRDAAADSRPGHRRGAWRRRCHRQSGLCRARQSRHRAAACWW